MIESKNYEIDNDHVECIFWAVKDLLEISKAMPPRTLEPAIRHLLAVVVYYNGPIDLEGCPAGVDDVVREFMAPILESGYLTETGELLPLASS